MDEGISAVIGAYKEYPCSAVVYQKYGLQSRTFFFSAGGGFLFGADLKLSG
jgi:hypothetical protein